MATAVEDLDGQGLADALVANHAALLAAECQEPVSYTHLTLPTKA